MGHPLVHFDQQLRRRLVTPAVRVNSIWQSARIFEDILWGEKNALEVTAEELGQLWTNLIVIFLEYSRSPTNSLVRVLRSNHLKTSARSMTEIVGRGVKRLVPLAMEYDVNQIYAVGARMIMENATVLALAGNDEQMWAVDMVHQLSERHSRFYCLLCHNLAGLRQDLRFGVFRNTAMTVFDLALMTPLWPHDTVLPSANFTWEDLHPGHRFFKIVNVLSRRQDLIVPTLEHYESFQDSVCDELGWPRVRQTVKALENSHLDDLRMFDHADMTFFQTACKLRQACPSALLFPIVWRYTCDLAGIDSGLDTIAPILATIFSDGDIALNGLNDQLFHKRLAVRTYGWIAHRLMETKGLDPSACDYLGGAPPQREVAWQRVVSALEGRFATSNGKRDPLLQVRDYTMQ
jgi:hypothetical protein